VGPVESCAEQLNERRALGVDLPIINMVGRDPAEMGRTLEKLLA
jgi:hypothetical protein